MRQLHDHLERTVGPRPIESRIRGALYDLESYVRRVIESRKRA